MMDCTYSYIEISFHGETEIYQRQILLDRLAFCDDIIIPIIHKTTNKLVEDLGNL